MDLYESMSTKLLTKENFFREEKTFKLFFCRRNLTTIYVQSKHSEYKSLELTLDNLLITKLNIMKVFFLGF